MSPSGQRPGPWLGVDLGQARVGLAACDPDLLLATPLETAPRAGRSLAQLARDLKTVAAGLGARRVVVGWPLNMDGSAGPKAAEAGRLAAALDGLGVPTTLQDERRTTVEAEARLHEAGRRAKAQRGVIDQAAAVVILQAALDAHRIQATSATTSQNGKLLSRDRPKQP